MKSIWNRIAWGLFLIVLGGFWLLQTLDLVPERAITTWALLFGGAGLVFLIGYLASDWRDWPALIPAVLCGDIAMALALTEMGAEGEVVGGAFLLVLSVPFWLAFLLAPKANWWGLIPGWALSAIGGIILAIPLIGERLLPTLILTAIGLPFLIVYFARREHWWAIIPASVLVGIGLLLLLEETLGGDLFASLTVLAVALPFWVIFLARRDQWWAVIPAGILTTAFVVTVIATSDLLGANLEAYGGAIFFGGLALTFGLVWAQRRKLPTEWAKYPAAVLAVMALVALMAGSVGQLIWGVALILLGLWLVLRRGRPGLS